MHTHKIEAQAGDQSVIVTVVLAEENSAAGSMDVSLTLELPLDAAESLHRQLERAINQQAVQSGR